MGITNRFSRNSRSILLHLALQKLKQLGVLKAIGMSMGQITRIQLSQVGILSVIGIGIGLGLALALTPFLPVAMPFYMRADNVVISASFINHRLFVARYL